MNGNRTSTQCLLKSKHRRVDATCEFPRGCGRFPVVMDSSDSEDGIGDHSQFLKHRVVQVVPRKYPPPRILKGSFVQRDFPSAFQQQDLLSASKEGLQKVVSATKPMEKAAAEIAGRKCPSLGMNSSDCDDISDHGQFPQNPTMSKASSVQRDFSSGFGRQDFHSASKEGLLNTVSASNPKEKAAAEAASRKCHSPGILTDFLAKQIRPAAKQNMSSVSNDISTNDRRKQNSVSQENIITNSCGNQNTGSVSNDIFLRNGKNATRVAGFRPKRRFNVTLGNKETGQCHQKSSARCDEVKKVLRLFHQVLAKLWKENARKPKMEKDYNIPRHAALFLKDYKKWINTSKRVGPVPGVNIGDKFRFQAELNVIGLHCHFYNGIDYMKKNGISLATSIVVSERYANNMESSNVLIYSGSGGNPAVRGQQPLKDQKLERGNLALKHSMDCKTPVRVICKVKLKSPQAASFEGTCKRKNLNPIYVYDGLFTVEKFWEERGEFGKLVYKFKLKRNLDQPQLP